MVSSPLALIVIILIYLSDLSQVKYLIRSQTLIYTNII